MLITWISSQPFAQRSRSSLVRVGPRRRAYAEHLLDRTQKKALHYSPWTGSIYFWYKNHLLTFRCRQKEIRFSVEEEISISCLGWSPKILRVLLGECRTEYLNLVKNKTSIFEHQAGDWKRTRTSSIRLIDTVILNGQVKKDLVEDISQFLDPKSRSWYSQRGFPYRRAYLLYGPPGTGKSSLSLSIAGYFDLDIYILNLSSLDDNSLSSLFAELPQHCVILLEDVDAVGATQSREAKRENSNNNETRFPGEAKSLERVSLSCLLNVLDGVASQEGRVLFMTTNHVERLDDALIRPGRVDRKIPFGLASKEIIAELFRIVYQHSDDVTDKEVLVRDDVIEQQAVEFASKVPDLEFSPAEIIAFLLENRQSPSTAVEGVQQWMTKIREGKKEDKKADPPLSSSLTG